MKRCYVPVKVWVLVVVVAAGLAQGCRNGEAVQAKPDTLAIRKSIAEAPVLDASAAIAKMQVEDGFAVKLVASEPLVAAPVALSFDERGRIWAVEMQDYMPDTVGTGEDAPGGKIVILSDKNGDGVMDDSKVFLDGLVLPRGICFIDSGILVAEPPRLWYYDIKDDKPVHIHNIQRPIGANMEVNRAKTLIHTGNKFLFGIRLLAGGNIALLR